MTLNDLAAERARLQKELGKVEADIKRVDGKLGNADFMARAPEEVVEENRERLAVLPTQRGKKLEIEWTGVPLHIDDKLRPKKSAGPEELAGTVLRELDRADEPFEAFLLIRGLLAWQFRGNPGGRQS